nr:hypothetical protein [Tanacetum cinerariifolium]
ENCYNNEIFNMFTQEEQYTELLEPIPESQQVPHNDNNVISEVTNVEQEGETVEQHSANFEETRALYDSLYQNLVVEVEKVNSEEAGIQLQAEEYDLMAAAVDLDEIKEANANCILMANLQQASSSGTQTDSAPVYDTDGSAENNNDVISEVTRREQGEETVEHHPANFEETRALYESLYQNLAVEVEKVNSVNRKLKETNADLTTELASYKNQKNVLKLVKKNMTNLKGVINSPFIKNNVFQDINALHLSTGKQIMTLNEQIFELNKLSKENQLFPFFLKKRKG